jgi:phage terminase large subunit
MLDKTSTVSVEATADHWWPPNYADKYFERARSLEYVRQNPKMVPAIIANYARGVDGCIEFIEDWLDTFDPRNVGTNRLTTMPFIMFPRQHELIRFLFALMDGQGNGLIEKSRDMGATWVCGAVSLWFAIFKKGTRIGWGSRKADLVDRIGDMDSIFEKMRFMMRSLPPFLIPRDFDVDGSMGYMKIIVEAKDASITGESGDDIGRGGRTFMYFKDESAHYIHPETIEASLGENTRIQIDISSVNGLGNVFHTTRENGIVWEVGMPIRRDCANVFIMDWHDHPDKTEQWYQDRKAFYTSKGLYHKFAQEIDRNYAASVEGVIIPFEWIMSAIDADIKLGLVMDDGGHQAALDVADGEHGDRNAMVKRKGVKLHFAAEWGERDTGVTARRTIENVAIPYLQRRTLGDITAAVKTDTLPITIQYDCIGVGSGVKAEINRLTKDENIMPVGVSFIPWDAGAAVLWPEKRVIEDADGLEDRSAPTWEDFAQNLKAQGWWLLRRRFENTHKAVTEGVRFPIDEMICIDSRIACLDQIKKELAQPTKGLSARLKLIVNKTPKGTKSPNIGDCIMMCYHPAISYMYDSSMSWVG